MLMKLLKILEIDPKWMILSKEKKKKLISAVLIHTDICEIKLLRMS